MFERRVNRLPVKHLRTRIAAAAMMRNESRALDRYEREHNLTREERAPLGTWHMRATHDRIAGVRPNLMPPRRASGSYVVMRKFTTADKFQRFLVRWRLWNALNGTKTWLHNRAVDLRATIFRLQGQR